MIRIAFACIVTCLSMRPAFGTPVLDLDALPEDWRPYIGVSVGSKHFGAERDFQEFNPGALVGAQYPLGWQNGAWGIEAGIFQNSYDERSVYAGTWVDWPVVEFSERFEGRLGLFFAYAEYPQLKEEADDAGVLTIGNFVPILAAQASVRLDDQFSLVARFGPGISESDLIVGLQAWYLF